MRNDAERSPEDLFDGLPQGLAICRAVQEAIHDWRSVYDGDEEPSRLPASPGPCIRLASGAVVTTCAAASAARPATAGARRAIHMIISIGSPVAGPGSPSASRTSPL